MREKKRKWWSWIILSSIRRWRIMYKRRQSCWRRWRKKKKQKVKKNMNPKNRSDSAAFIDLFNLSLRLRIFDVNSRITTNTIQALHIRCCRTSLDISYVDRIINGAMCVTIREEIHPLEDLMSTVQEREFWNTA